MTQRNRKSTRGSVDQRRQGPTSLQGAEASELPDKGRGPVETDPGREAARKTPGQTGGVIGGDTGLRAMPDSAEADDHGSRKRN